MRFKDFNLTEGIFIAAVPVIGYWLAYLYQLGYCSYFNIPTSFIVIDIKSIIVAIIGYVTILGILNLISAPIISLYKALPHPIGFYLSKVLLALFILGGFLITKHFSKAEIYFVSIFITVTAFLDFVLPVFTHSELDGYLSKLNAQYKIDKESHNLISATSKKMGKKNLLYVIILFFTSYIVYFSGGYNARIKTNFIFINGKDNIVVLKQYQNSFLAATVDTSKKQVYPEYKLISVNADSTGFVFKNIGPLEPKEER